MADQLEDGPASGDDQSTQSADLPTGLPLVLAAELRQVDFEAPIRNLNRVHEHALNTEYQAVIKAAANSETEKVFRFMEALTSIHLDPSNKGDVWVARAAGPGWTTPVPSMFQGPQCVELEQVVATIQHPSLRARVADIIWTNDRRRGSAALLAAEAYRDCVAGLVAGRFEPMFDSEPQGVHEALPLLNRMLQIINASMKKAKRPDWAQETLLSVYQAALGRGDFVVFVRAAELGLYYELLDASEVAKDAEGVAVAAKADDFADAVREPWDLAARLYEKQKNTDAARRCRIAAFECTLAMRNQVLGSASAQAAWVMDALQELRHIAGLEEREQELEIELRRLQKESLSEMAAMPISFDVKPERERLADIFDKMSLPEALRYYAMVAEPRQLDELKTEALETAQVAPLSAMISVAHIDRDGRVAHKTPGAPTAGTPDEAWFDNMIARSEGLRRYQVVATAIDPIRIQIQDKFGIGEREIAAMLRCCSFVPESQAPLISLGFIRFFQGDLMSAVHLVIPQLEPCLRHILKLNGHDPAKRRDDATEEDLSLSGIYSRFSAELGTILGAALSDEIDRLFNRRPGPAIRHEMAHGQLSANACFHPDVYYAVWLMYRVCCLFALPAWESTVAPALAA